LSDTHQDGGPDGDGEPETSKTFTFDPPVKLRQASYSEMTLSEPSGKMVRQAEGRLRGGVNVESLRLYQIALITAISKWPQEAVEELPVSKLDEMESWLSRFTNLGRLIGRL
jgi:hypothetical protein